MKEEELFFQKMENLGEAIQKWNDLIAEEIALPGNWSPTLFFKDLKIYPPKSKKLLVQNLTKACRDCITYREFFLITRDSVREIKCKEIWNLFDSDKPHSMMLYFEDFFLKHFDEPDLNGISQEERAILSSLYRIIGEGMEAFLREIGCINIEWFVKEPLAYVSSEGTPRLSQNERDEALLQRVPYYFPSSRSDLLNSLQLKKK